MNILPVIHHLDMETSVSQVRIARECGAHGVFLIDHAGEDELLIDVACVAKGVFPDFPIGLNLLSFTPTQATLAVIENGLDMVWADTMDVSSAGMGSMGRALRDMAAAHPKIGFFASVAFKYQPVDPDPAKAAELARKAGFIPTTSGPRTGSPPTTEKVMSMSAAAGGMLALASGITTANVSDFSAYSSHILVSTGICIDEHRIDPMKLRTLISQARC